DEAVARTGEVAGAGADSWRDPREDGLLPDVYIPMGQTAENVALLRGISREEMDHFGVRSQNLAEQAIAAGFWAREITPVTLPDGTVV
ncbi:acetyl-CoA C-acyltransferase, partial [Acinetobacter baumannii]